MTAVRANGTAVMMTYPFYRLVVLGTAIVVGVGLWLMISRTRIGMMIRAGVDDRSMLSASGINVHMLFAVVFAIGAGLAGFAGVIGGSALSLAPGEDVRYLLASLVVVIVGGMGSITGAAIGALLIGLAEQIGLVYFPTYGVVLTFVIMVVALALRPQGIMGTTRTSADSRSSPSIAEPRRDRPGPVRPRPGRARGRTASLSRRCVGVLRRPDRRAFADLGLDRALADAARRLRRHGVAGPAHVRRRRRLFGRDPRRQQHGRARLWLAVAGLVPVAILLAGTVSALIGAISVRTAGIYTIMITLAVATAFFYFAQQNYSLFNGHSGFPAFRRRTCSASNGAIPCPSTISASWSPRPIRAVVYCARSTFGRALMAARDNARRMRAVGYDVTLRAVVPISSPASSPASPACFTSGSTAASRPARSASARRSILVIAVIGGMRHPIGPFIGAAVYVLLKTFAIDIVGAERFNTLIGLVFLVIVFVSPDGVLGLWRRLKPRLAAEALRCRVSGEASLRAQTESNREHRISVNRRLLLGRAAAGLTPPAALADDSIKVGLLATLEGAFTVLGQDSMRGARMALKEANDMAGGKKIEVIKGSSDASPDSAVKAARKLVEQDGVKILIGPLSGDEGLAVKDYAKTQPNVTFVNGTSAAQDTTLRDPAPNFFRFTTDGAQWMAGLGEYAYNDKKYKTVVTVAEDYSFPYTQVFGFMAGFCKAGGHVPKKFWVPIGNKDFSSIIAAIPDKVDAIYVALGGADGVNFLTQYQQAGGAAPLIGGSITVDQTVLGTKGKQRDFVIGTPSAGPIADT